MIWVFIAVLMGASVDNKIYAEFDSSLGCKIALSEIQGLKIEGMKVRIIHPCGQINKKSLVDF